MLTKLLIFELKNKFIYSRNWIIYSLFLVINLSLYPLLFEKQSNILQHVFCAALVSSILLITNLAVSNFISEELKKDYLEQLKIFQISKTILFTSSIIICLLEMMIVLLISLPLSLLLYQFSFEDLLLIYLAIFLIMPSIVAINLFGSFITNHSKQNNILSLLITMPLLCSALIILSLIFKVIFTEQNIDFAMPYFQIEIGLNLVILPILNLITKYIDLY